MQEECLDSGSYRCGCADGACGDLEAVDGEEHVRRWAVYEVRKSKSKKKQKKQKKEKKEGSSSTPSSIVVVVVVVQKKQERQKGKKGFRKASRKNFDYELCKGVTYLLFPGSPSTTIS